jgi:hypothetical protein
MIEGLSEGPGPVSTPLGLGSALMTTVRSEVGRPDGISPFVATSGDPRRDGDGKPGGHHYNPDSRCSAITAATMEKA